MNSEILQALKEYHQALHQESLADPKYIDVAIAKTNAAKNKLDAICKKVKLDKGSVPSTDKSSAEHILAMASKIGLKGDYSVYISFKRQLDAIGLSQKEYEKAVIKLANILKV